MDLAYSIVAFIVAIGVLVTVHEYGHYWVARRLGVKVLRYSIGFGKPLLTWRGRDADRVEYVIAAVPLGGYVKMLDEAEADVSPDEVDRAFNRQSLGVRIAVVVAGPLANFLFAIVAYAAMFMVGIDGLKPVVGTVAADSIAARAGIVPGIEITAVNGQPTRTWEGVVEAFLGGTLGEGEARLAARDADGRSMAYRVDLSRLALDDIARGEFFDRLGVEPDRPRLPAVIGEVTPDSPAAAAGFATGDRVLSVDDVALADWGAFVTAVRGAPGRALAIAVERAGERLVLDVVPATVTDETGSFGRIGAGPQASTSSLAHLYATERYGPWQALERGAAKTWEMSSLTVRMLWKMVRAEVSVKNLSGPISIAQYAGLSAQVGLARFLGFLALVSISLGILNLLPIPLLDGGHLLYYFIELLRGKPLSEEAQFLGQRLGITLLVGLMGLAFYNDLARLFG